MQPPISVPNLASSYTKVQRSLALGGVVVPQNTGKREPSVVGPLRINPERQVE